MRFSSRLGPRALGVAAALAVSSFALPSHADRVAVVDVQHAVMQTEDGIRAQATLKKLFDKRQQELDGKQTELAKMKEDIEKQARFLSRMALQRRMEDWQRRMIELQTVFVNYDKELQKKQGELTGPILKKLLSVVARVAKKSQFELVIDKQAAPYARPDLDLTDQVVQLYNSGEADAADPPKP
jgi:outer membrane protein